MKVKHLSAIVLIVTAVVWSPVKAQVAVAGELRVMRADFFRNYAGSFLSVEVFDDQVSADGGSGPSLFTRGTTATPITTWRCGPTGLCGRSSTATDRMLDP